MSEVFFSTPPMPLHEQRGKARGAEETVGAGCFVETESLHAGKADAIGERERLVLVAQHPLLGLMEEVCADPWELHDHGVIKQMKEPAALMRDFSCNKE